MLRSRTFRPVIAAIALVVTSPALGAPRDHKKNSRVSVTTADKDKPDDDEVTVTDDPDSDVDDDNSSKRTRKAADKDKADKDKADKDKADKDKAAAEEDEARRKRKKAKAKESDEEDDSAETNRKNAKDEEAENRGKDRRHSKDKQRGTDDAEEGTKPKRGEKARTKDPEDDEERKPKHSLRSRDKDHETDDAEDAPKKKPGPRAKVKTNDKDAGDDENSTQPKRGARGKAKEPSDDEDPKPKRSPRDVDADSTNDEAKAVHKTKDRPNDKRKLQADDAEIEIDGDDAGTRHRAEPIALPGEQPPPVPAGPRSRAINDRPLTVRKDQLEFHGGLSVLSFTLPSIVPGTTTSTTITSLPLGVTYGIGDHSELGGDYAPSLSPGSITGPLTLHGAYRASHSAKLDVAIAAAIAVDFADAIDPATMMTATKTSFALDVGVWARYRVTAKISLFTGLPALPNSPASLTRSYFALPPLPYQLSIGVTNGSAIALELPVGVGFQAAPKIYAFAATNLANIKIAKTVNAFLFADFIPISIGGFYSLAKLDLGAELGGDLKQGTDYLRFQLVARYYK